MKRSLIVIATVATLGVIALGTSLTLADPGDEGRPGWGPGMMRGYGPGMMGGYGHGAGRMGGYGPGAGWMGYGMGPAANAGVQCPGYAAAANADPLSLEDAQKIVQQRLAWMGNDRLKVGKVEAKGDTAFTAEIVTLDNSLVEKVEIDRKTGFMRSVR